jgi:hypothetical protein
LGRLPGLPHHNLMMNLVNTSITPILGNLFDRITLVDEGDIGLIINIGTGIQVGCALYYF